MDAVLAERTVRAYYDALNRQDAAVAAANWVDEGSFADPVGARFLANRDEITQFLTRVLSKSKFSRIAFELTWLGVCGDQVATHWFLNTTTTNGTSHRIEGVSIFRLNENCKFSKVDTYFEVPRRAPVPEATRTA